MAKNMVIGNWKMNLDIFQAEELLQNIANKKKELKKNVILGVAPSAVYLHSALNILTEGKVWVGSQNIHHESNGPYTGEISARMIGSLACQFTLIGHSERREYFNETNEQLKLKVDLSYDNDLIPVYCCGETLEQRRSGEYLSIIEEQIESALFHLAEVQIKQAVIAYEPVWAIGTGETASPEQAQEVHSFIRSLLAKKYGEDVAAEISILYGGSCKPANSQELFSQKDIDGGLIGGASLNVNDFIAIANSF